MVTFPPSFGFASELAPAPTWAAAARPHLSPDQATAARGYATPLTLPFPAVAIVLTKEDNERRRTGAVENGEGLSSDELSHIAQAVEPHLRAMIMAFHLEGLQTPNGPRAPHHSLPEWAVIYAVYEKAAMIHIVAHFSRYVADAPGYIFNSVVVDALPFRSMGQYDSARHCVTDRLRFAMALLTLKRQIFLLSDALGDTAWPPNIFDSHSAATNGIIGAPSPVPSQTRARSSDRHELFVPEDWLEDEESDEADEAVEVVQLGEDEILELANRARGVVEPWLAGMIHLSQWEHQSDI